MMERGDSNIKDVVLLTKETDSFGIHDILPHLQGNVKMEHFKIELCDELRDKNDRIQKLKAEMDAYKISADSLKNEYKSMDTSYVNIPMDKKCLQCNFLLYQEDYIIFACQHCYHKVTYIYTYTYYRTASTTKSSPLRSMLNDSRSCTRSSFN